MINIISLETLDRTIYEHLRRELVKRGHLPDITTFNSKETYKTAKNTIKGTTGKYLIEIFGLGASESRDKKQSHSIIINRKPIVPSELGGGTEYFTPNKNGEVIESYTKGKYPERSADVGYEVRIITNTVKVDRIITDVIFKALGWSKNIATIVDGSHNLDTKTVQCVFTGDVNVTSTDFIEKIYNYTLKEVWLDSTAEVYEGTIPVLKHIDIKVKELPSGDDITEIGIGEVIP